MSTAYYLANRKAFEACKNIFEEDAKSYKEEYDKPYVPTSPSDYSGIYFEKHHIMSGHGFYGVVQACENTWEEIIERTPEHDDGLGWRGARSVATTTPWFVKRYIPDYSIGSMADLHDIIVNLPDELIIIDEYDCEVEKEDFLTMIDNYERPCVDPFFYEVTRDRYHDEEGFPYSYGDFC